MCLESYLDISYLIWLYLCNSGLYRICGDLTTITFIICMTELCWTAPCMLMYARISIFQKMARQILLRNDVEMIHHPRPCTHMMDLWWVMTWCLIWNVLAIRGYFLYCGMRWHQFCWTPGRLKVECTVFLTVDQISVEFETITEWNLTRISC